MYSYHYSLVLFVPLATCMIITARHPFEERVPQKRQIETCTDIVCVDSYVSIFESTADAFTNTAAFDPTSIISQINSIQSGLTSLGITSLTSFLPQPTQFEHTASTEVATVTGSAYNGPNVSDISKSYAEYTKTRTTVPTNTAIPTTSESGGFTFGTSSFEATVVRTPESSAAQSTSVEVQTTSSSIAIMSSSGSSSSSLEGTQSTVVVLSTTTPSVSIPRTTLVQTAAATSASSEPLPTSSGGNGSPTTAASSSSSTAGAGVVGVGVESWGLALAVGLLGTLGF